MGTENTSLNTAITVADEQISSPLSFQVERVSVASDGTEGNNSAFEPAISADGRFVTYSSRASNLVSGDTNGTSDVFVLDRQTNTIERVSITSDGTEANDSSFYPAISEDGRYVSYTSRASNIFPGDTNGAYDVFVFDRQTDTTERVSVVSDATGGGGFDQSISADGRFVTYSGGAIFVFDRQTNTTERVSVASSNSEESSISADGRFVTYQSPASNQVAGDTNNTDDIFMFDRQTNTTERVSVASDGTQGNSGSQEPSISADGRFVTYQSAASNLVAGDTNATDDIFLFDRQTNTTTRLSAASDGTEGNAASFEPAISADGHFVTYTSLASNLVPGDSNVTADIFVVQTPQPIDGVVEDGDERNILLNATGPVIVGTNERDVITGQPEMDIIFAGAGDDLVDGAQGNNLILGGEGSDFLDAGDGDDIVDAGAGNDFVLAGTDDDIVDAGTGDDSVDAGADNDFDLAGTGDDGIAGGEGNDVILGGEGNDGLDGQEGNEDPMSTAYRVILEGSQEVPANASTASGFGAVIFDSAAVAASYSFDIQGLDFGPITSGQVPTDPNDVNNTHFHNQVRGVNGQVVFGQITPAHDNDDLAIELNADGSWSVSGRWETTDPAPIDGPSLVPGGGVTFATVLGSGAVGSDIPLYFNVHTVQFPGGAIRGQLVAIADDIDNVVTGTTGNDVLSGLRGNDAILGLTGDDILDGGNGNDVLDGGGGNDTLTGGNGNDMLDGSVGNDVVEGGNGNDTMNGGDGNDVLSGGRGDDNINTGQGDDVVLGGQGNDRIGGMAGRDVVMAGAGDDFIAWNDPTGDVVFGDGGNDTILGGNVAADEIHGGAGDDLIRAFATSPESATASDKLFGDAGDDVVTGGNAADTIEGGRGDDFLTGNDGADVFIFRDNRTGEDTITDFDPSEDVVQLVGFEEDFDPLAGLSATTQGAELDLGQGDSVLFMGRTVAEFGADDFQIV